ncbi:MULTISPECIES: ATP-binding protein [Bacillaceae]|uniref:histidine kinase n=1 Tax=Sutcliffiella horikoshii TaxID=79883 RepID=A0A5D4SVD3_9BACI|nr:MULTISPECIES: ATP-binding protein [Bacillaceae]TYS65816.1 two-component sensor histidine kinase [Sutcliffiella horikoshii]
MFENVGHVLYHVLIILFPILFYYQFLNKGALVLTKKVNYRFLFIMLVMVICTMSFPIEVTEGSNYDQKLIPVILSFLYGGLVTGAIVVVSMLYYLYMIGDSNIIAMVINYFILATLLILFRNRYSSLSLKKKISIISFLLLLITSTRAIRLLYLNEEKEIFLNVLVSIITWISLVTAIMIIENLNMQMQLQHELQRSEKLKVVSELAASVAHEVRNPMTSTRGFLQLMSQDDNLNGSQKRYIDISIEELDRAQSIIQDYLSLAKPNKQGMDKINVSKELEHVIQLMSTYTALNNTNIRQEIEGELYIKANKDEMKQVLINLIKNGIEAIDKDGTVTVKAFSFKGMVLIEIRDNGVGMTPQQVERLGTPFYSTKDKGTGIGLTISFQIIELLQGKIEVTSEVGKGSIFTIKLPMETSENS